MGKGTKLYCSACKTGNWIVKNTTQNAPKVIHDNETQNQKNFLRRGHSPWAPYPDPSPSGDYLRRLNPRARPRRLWRLIFHSTGLCTSKLTLKKPRAMLPRRAGIKSIVQNWDRPVSKPRTHQIKAVSKQTTGPTAPPAAQLAPLVVGHTDQP